MSQTDRLRAAGDAASSREERIGALRALVRENPGLGPGGASVPPPTGEVNNHVHTIYSFSPYTPSMAAWKARDSGLSAAGSVDHDSVGAAEEMLEACSILGIGGTVGFELRVSFLDTPFAGRKTNNPDSVGISYMTVQGIPRSALRASAEFLAPVAVARGARNRKTTAAVSAILAAAGFEAIDYDRDVLPLSKAAEGGSVTERHILAAAALSILRRLPAGPGLVEGLARSFDMTAPARVALWLSDPANPHLLYDLIGLLKSGFLDRVFVQPGPEECFPAKTVAAFARGIGAIPAYAYLGDVAESPTGDKKAEKFEDDFLDDLVPLLAELGFQAITYMPPRNTAAQLARVRALAARHGLMEISGVDINSSRQSFNCPEVLEPANRHLVDATWALIAHEKLSGLDPRYGLFSPDNPRAGLALAERIAVYARIGRAIDTRDPENPGALGRLWRREK
jgi:hypothetical protein